MKAKLGSNEFVEAPVISGTHPAIVRGKKVDAGNGIIPAAAIVALDADGEVIPYAKAEEAMSGTINGTNKVFTLDFGGPIEPGTVVIDNNNTSPQQVVDDGYGNLYDAGAASGSVNYKTGDISVTFETAPAEGKTVVATVRPKIAGVLRSAAHTDQVSGEDVDDVAPVVIHGTVFRDNLSVGIAGDEPEAVDIAALERNGIWAE